MRLEAESPGCGPERPGASPERAVANITAWPTRQPGKLSKAGFSGCGSKKNCPVLFRPPSERKKTARFGSGRHRNEKKLSGFVPATIGTKKNCQVLFRPPSE
jgi:hypothetical protein